MSFFKLSDGSDTKADGNMDMGGSIEPIPNNTNVLAAITETKIDEYQGDRYINNTWTVLKPDEYKNRKVFQKVHVFSPDSAKRDKAIKMLAAIDANCGGKLVKSGKEPTDQLLAQSLLNRPMVCNLQVWKITEDREGNKLDEPKSGNWVSKVSPRKAADEKPKPEKQESEPVNLADMDDDIPF